MRLGALPLPKFFLDSSKITNVYKKREVIRYTIDITIDYHNKFNLQEHREVSPYIPLEIKYNQQKKYKMKLADVENKNEIWEIQH